MSTNIGEVTNSVFALLEHLDEDGAKKVLLSVAILKGIALTNAPRESSDTTKKFQDPTSKSMTAAEYFRSKNPSSKIEELAIAARFLEIQDSTKNQHDVSSFSAIFRQASRNFDSINFINDMKNAKKAGLFIKGTPTGLHQLSYNGQNMVDSMNSK